MSFYSNMRLMMCFKSVAFAVSAVAVVLGVSMPCTGQALVWKSLSTAPPALVQVYRAGKISDPPPTLKDVQGARFVRIKEPGQSLPLFLVDPNQEDLQGAGGSPLLGYVPQDHSYKQVLYVYSQWSIVGNAPDIKAARRRARKGEISILKQRQRGLPWLFFPAADIHMPMHLWRFDGEGYRQ